MLDSKSLGSFYVGRRKLPQAKVRLLKEAIRVEISGLNIDVSYNIWRVILGVRNDRENAILWKQRTLAVILDTCEMPQEPFESENGLGNLEMLPVTVL